MQIVVVRALPGLGDLLCAVPALELLRAAHPTSRVTLLGLDRASWVPDRYPDLVDELAVLPSWPGLVDGAGDPEPVVRELSRRRPALVLQLHGSGPESNELAARLGGERLVGAARPGDRRPPAGEWVPWSDSRPEPLSCLDVVAAAVGRPAPLAVRLRFPVGPADQAEADALGLRAPYAVLHPGGTLPDRRWPPERFAAVADHLAAAGVEVAVTGTPAEQPLVAAVAGAARSEVVPLAGATSLGGFAAVLHGAAVVVTNDTGTSHLAAAVGARSVIVFLVTDPARWAPLTAGRNVAVDGRDGRDVTGEVMEAVGRHLAGR